MEHICTHAAAAVDEAIEATNDTTRAFEQLSDLLGDTPEDTAVAVALLNDQKALRDRARSLIAHKTQLATMWK